MVKGGGDSLRRPPRVRATNQGQGSGTNQGFWVPEMGLRGRDEELPRAPGNNKIQGPGGPSRVVGGPLNTTQWTRDNSYADSPEGYPGPGGGGNHRAGLGDHPET